MISVTEEISSLKAREQQLHTSLDNLRGQRSKVKEHKQLDKELALLIRKRQNLESLSQFEIGMPVHRADSRVLGKVTQIVITPGGLAEVWVSWDNKIEIPEQPNLLQPDAEALAQIVAVGERIVIGNSHEDSGKTFTVARVLARGWVESTNENVFPREYWTKVESPVLSKGDDQAEIATSHNATPVITPEINMIEESPEELGVSPKSIVTVETLASYQEIEELTEDEEKERHRLELKVERAFYEAGSALRELRDRRLYRSTHKTFEAYSQERFGMTPRPAYYLIAAAGVVENLEMRTNGSQILPTTERQVRPLANLEPEEQRQIWQQAVQEAGNKVPSGRIVKDIVQRLKEKPLALASDYCSIGDVFTLTRLEGIERKYNGCWAIAKELRDYTIAVDVHDTTLSVKPDNLQPLDSPDARRQLPETLKRIRRLRSREEMLDRCAYTVLESLGRQVYLTDVEEGVLQWLEKYYGIES
ncbi:hypothetical protein [Aliterella atlantica]|uniref:hypothetical protein n=1 Tax=Aliterella atlantica TaxID=1827278 RepID=UPI0009E23106|nr:hypothetical protein [Aliterella atlantica]